MDALMPRAHGCAGTANYLPYCRGATAGPQGIRLKAPTLGTLQTLPDESDSLSSSSVAETAGFSLHAGVATKANDRVKLERLCRYITRPAISMKRLSLTRNGQVRYELKTPWRNGTTHVIFEPLDFMYRMYGMPRAHGCARAANAKRPNYPMSPTKHLPRSRLR